MRPAKCLSANYANLQGAIKLEQQAGTRKLTRAERNEEVRQRLFDAAAQVVGEVGYAEASVAKITDLAGVALGTFYNHFPSRQALFDELLPTLGMEMARFIQSTTEHIRPESKRELARFQAFFGYLRSNPRFHRILNEAEFAAPVAYQRHIENISAPYQRILRGARERGELADFSDVELEVVVHLLMGARSYLSHRFSDPVGDNVFDAYAKLLAGGLYERKCPPDQ